jgi:hypothetical protein
VTIQFVGASAVVRGIGATLTPVPFRDNLGDQHLLCTGEYLGSQTLATPAGWTLQSHDTNAPQEKCFQFDSVGSTTIPGITWGAGSVAYAYILTFTGLAPAASALDVNGDRVANTTSSNIIGPAGSLTPTGGDELALLFGGKNKTSVSNGTAFTKPNASWDACPISDAPNGTAVAVSAAYWIQTTATAIAANSAINGSIVETATQAQQGSLLFLKPASAAALAGSGSAAASATAALTTAIRAAGAASAGITATAALTTWTTVVLAGAQYTGTGGIHDPNFWKDVDPPVGTTLYYDASKVAIYPNGEISATTNNCSAVVEFFDGTAWSVGIIIITPQMVSYASVVAAAAGAMTTAITMAGAALTAVSATGNLTAGIHLAGNALAIAQAAAALTTGIQLNAAALINITATGALSGGQASLQGNASVLSQALAQITTQIALAGQVAVNSTVVGALAAQIQLNAAAVALTQANAQIQTAIQLVGNANVVSSAAGAALLTTAFAGAANVVSSAMGALLTGLLVAGNALVNSQATADLSTGITLAGGAIVDSAAAFKPPGAESQFGRAVINVLSPTGLPVARSTFIAGSACIVTIAYYNAQGDAFVPNAVKYSVQDESTGFTLVPATDISNPELSNAITITGNSKHDDQLVAQLRVAPGPVPDHGRRQPGELCQCGV